MAAPGRTTGRAGRRQTTRRRGRWSTPLLGLVATVVLVAATGCGADTGGNDGGNAASQAGSAVAQDALSFEAQTLTGETLDAAQLAGTPVVLWFWAPWCTVCRAEAPEVAAIGAEFEDSVTFVGVPGLGKVEDMKDFVDATGTDGLTHAVDSDGSLWQRFGIISQPAFAFVSADGSVETFSGSLGADDLRQATEDLAAG